ncbi:hypothetical protein ACFV2S_01170 [Streptomyces sp. NPDC059695]|uniref:hypothetical protein n=1 Tax=Streptomyces sp. NPDC059695 TaxID=3346910 RepID=UPI0036CB0133
MKSTRMSRRAFVGTTLAATGALAAAAVRPATAAAVPRAPSPPLPALDPAALGAVIDDREHPPSTAARLSVGGTDGDWYGASGVADTRTGRPVTPHDRVRCSSTG